MTQLAEAEPAQIVVSPQFQAAMPALPAESAQMSQLSMQVAKPNQLTCRDLLLGETLAQAHDEAVKVWPQMRSNRAVLANYGTNAMSGVNQLNDEMLSQNPPVEVAEVQQLMKDLSRSMRGVGAKYDPSDAKVLKKYQDAKGGILHVLHIGKTFLQEFLDDTRSLSGKFDHVVDVLGDKQYKLLRNVVYFDELYKRNRDMIDQLIYVIGVMEIIRDTAAQEAAAITVSDNPADRGKEERAEILEFVTLLDSKISAFKARLWLAWAMAPEIRGIRGISLGIAARIDQTIDVTIPAMKGTILIWLKLSEAEQAQLFYQAVDAALNKSVTDFAIAAQIAIPEMAKALETPAMDPATIQAMTRSIAAQADGLIDSIKSGQQKRLELDQEILNSKEVIDESTQRVNQAKLEVVLASAQQKPLEIAHHVPAQLPAGSESSTQSA